MQCSHLWCLPLEEDARPSEGPSSYPHPLPRHLVDAATRARSQRAIATARFLETRDAAQTAEHRARSRVRFSEDMADIGVQNVHHVDTAAAAAPRGAGLQAKAKAANIASVHRAAAAERTAEAADPSHGGGARSAAAVATAAAADDPL